MLALLGTSFTFLMTALGAATVFFFARKVCERAQGALLGFAAGVMTAASVWSLILPAIEQTAAEGRLPPFLPAAAGIVLGALLLALLDEFTRQRGGERVTHSDFLLLSAITLHNIPEGGSVGLTAGLAAIAGDSASLSAAFALALGIGIQNIPEGAAVSLPLAGQGVSRWRAFWFGTGSGAVEPLFGILAALAIPLFLPVMPFMLAFAAGAMLYVVVEELIPAAHLSQHSDAGTLCFIFGFVVMMALDTALG